MADDRKNAPEELPMVSTEVVEFYLAERYGKISSKEEMLEDEETRLAEGNPILFSYYKKRTRLLFILKNSSTGEEIEIENSEENIEGYREGFLTCYTLLRRKAEAGKLENQLRLK